LNVILFASGNPYSLRIGDAIAKHHRIVAIVRPAVRRSGIRGLLVRLRVWWAHRRLRKFARDCDAPLVAFDGRRDGAVSRLQGDVFCIASFPYLLREPLLRVPKHGVLNVHPSLLPKHRGVDPLFWTFFHDDAEAGVTVHVVDAGVDSGAIVSQESLPLQRGIDGSSLLLHLADIGARLLLQALEDLERGTLSRRPQEAGSRDPLPSRAKARIAFDEWPAERVWHVLRGAGVRRFADADGNPLRAGRATTFKTGAHEERPGTVARADGETRLYCRDGWVTLEA
jgi:methionyl-tRNA formyltransferase